MEKVVIMGGGPAGCTAALYTARADLKPLVFEGELSQTVLPGGQLMTTTEVENFPGYPNGISGPELMDDLKKQAENFGARFEYKTVTSVDLSSRPLRLFVNEEVYETETLIIATGATARYLGLESEQRFMNKGVSACATCDGALPQFRGKTLVVVGGGDTAMEEAMFLAKFADHVHVVHRRDKFRASKIMGDRVINHPKITVEWNSVVDEIFGNDTDGVTGVRLKSTETGLTRELACVGYFAAIGHQPNTALFKDVLPMDESGYLLTEGKSCSVGIPGVFACGDVQDNIYRQAVTAAGSGCMAALDAARWLESVEGA
ncbi:MAG: thioredoxin-disulfide reductase [Candidatus Hydrogenedentes bacterium]|jgi:thioredoxin reductase (NADPH)|nr:thioredoxin-disulfide reductase [Candidatus Hydrogenedentota bacterium]